MKLQDALQQIKTAPKEYKYYCYTLNYPSGIPFYIGIGHGKRISHHEQYNTKKYAQNTFKTSVIKKIQKIDQVDYSLIAFSQDKLLMGELEKQLISHYGRRDNSTGILTNLTDGGEGVVGFVVSEEIKQHLKEKANEQWSDPEARARKAEQAKEQMHKRYSDPKEREKQGEISKQRWNDPEFKDRIMKSKKAASSSPDYKEKMSKIQKLAQNKPHLVEFNKQAGKERWANPEYREMMKNAQERKKRKNIIQSILRSGKAHKDFKPLVLNRLKTITQDKFI